MSVHDRPDAAEALEVPEGYQPIRSTQPFGTLVGPIFEKPGDEAVRRGFRVLERHCNQGGIAHGGMMMTFIDVILGTVVWRVTGRPALISLMPFSWQRQPSGVSSSTTAGRRSFSMTISPSRPM